MYLVTVISSRNLLHAIMNIKKIISPSDPDNAGGGGGGGGVRAPCIPSPLCLPYLCSKQFESQAPRLECVLENYFLYVSSKTYVVGTQKSRVNETVLLSTQNTYLNEWVRKSLKISKTYCRAWSIHRPSANYIS